MSADEARIRTVVLDYLSGIQDLSTVRTKDVRNHVLETLALPKDYFGGDAKEILLSVISNYQIPLAVPKKSTPVKATSARSTPVKAAPAAKTTPSKQAPVQGERLVTPQRSPHKSYDGSSEEDSDEKGSPTPKKAAKPAASPAAKKVAKKNSMKRTFDGEVDSSSDEDIAKAIPRQRPAPTKAPRLSAAAASPKATPKTPKHPKEPKTPNELKTPKTPKTPKATTPRTPRSQDDDVPYDGEYKTGRFTKFESDTIREAAERYAAEQGIEITDLCTQYKKEDGGEKSKHLPFWREVKELLPHRKKEV